MELVLWGAILWSSAALGLLCCGSPFVNNGRTAVYLSVEEILLMISDVNL